jgi:ATP-dependent Clp protease ATP-binding subunit ClpA
MLATSQPALLERLARLAPHARAAVEASTQHALSWHARAAGLEHLLWQLMRDDACAAHRAVVHAFADPESIALEAQALCEGLLVVGSGVTLPFSELATRALFAARALADARGDQEVAISHLLEASLALLPAQTGRPPAVALEVEVVIEPAAGQGLFKRYGPTTRRALSQACKLAHRYGRESIAPAHLLLAGLEADALAGQALGLSLTRMRASLAGSDEDLTPAPPRPIEFDPGFARLLEAAPAGADTLQLLELMIALASTEVQALLLRQRVTPAMIQHARSRFVDP